MGLLEAVERGETRMPTLAAMAIGNSLPPDVWARWRVHEPRRLRDGTRGWCVRAPRRDDCFAAAAATVLQVPISKVPDGRTDERLALGVPPDLIDSEAKSAWVRWLAKRGLRWVVHEKVPVRRKRWLGVIELPGMFTDHCLVMTGNELLWDPILGMFEGVTLPRGLRVFTPENITYGLSFQRIQRKEK
jgi:hypothetical protein